MRVWTRKLTPCVVVFMFADALLHMVGRHNKGIYNTWNPQISGSECEMIFRTFAPSVLTFFNVVMFFSPSGEWKKTWLHTSRCPKWGIGGPHTRETKVKCTKRYLCILWVCDWWHTCGREEWRCRVPPLPDPPYTHSHRVSHLCLRCGVDVFTILCFAEWGSNS